MRDGLYRVVSRYFVAGFVVEGGVVVRRAPILRNWHFHDVGEYTFRNGFVSWVCP